MCREAWIHTSAGFLIRSITLRTFTPRWTNHGAFSAEHTFFKFSSQSYCFTPAKTGMRFPYIESRTRGCHTRTGTTPAANAQNADWAPFQQLVRETVVNLVTSQSHGFW